MATGGEVAGQKSDKTGSEDLEQLKCQPCLEDGDVHEAVGMCVDCDDYLCQKCFQGHTLPKPSRNHQLIDKEQMLQRQIPASPIDTCTETCLHHEEEIINHYCTKHCLLGCAVCIKEDHTTCKTVHYIPDIAKELASNIDYRQAERRLQSALGTFETATENYERDNGEIESSCAEAVMSIKGFRRSIDEALSMMETELIETVEAIKAKEMEELAAHREKFRAQQEELQSVLVKMEGLKKTRQHCSLFTNMMRMTAKLTDLDAEITGEERDTSKKNLQIKFSPNQETLKMLSHSNAFGMMLTAESAKGNIVQAKREKDIYINLNENPYVQKQCLISGLVVLPNNRLVAADNKNQALELVSLQSNKVLTELKLSSGPWDLAAISNNKVAVTMPEGKKIIFVAITTDSNMIIDSTLAVSGNCRGIDYRNKTLAVSYSLPIDKVQVLNMQGSVLHEISASQFENPYYLTYGHDGTKLYVSNYSGHNVVCVKLDGTVVATYRDSELRGPLQPVMDSKGDLFVCAEFSSTVHQITEDCKLRRVLLCHGDGLQSPLAICLNEEKDRFYMSMKNSSTIKVYSTLREPQ